MFGFIGKRKFSDGEIDGFKGKLSFEDAVLVKETGNEESTKINLQSPKPSACLMYIKQDSKKVNTYNSDRFELRGVKQYWMHKDIKRLNENLAGKDRKSVV